MTATAACGHGPPPRTIASQAEKAVLTIRSFNQWGEESQGGSGFFVDGEGTFVTSHHVIYDGKENLLARNVERTAQPMMRFTPSETGPYFLRVRMAECSYDPCSYGVALFRELLQIVSR